MMARPDEPAAVVELREQLAVVLRVLARRDAVIEGLRGELDVANAQIAELRRQLGRNPHNSSKPPNSDGLAKPEPRSLRCRGARKPGGQDGHPGTTLAPVAVADAYVAHEPGCCRGCGDDLAGALEVGREARQVFDLPAVRPRVIEHQLTPLVSRVLGLIDMPGNMSITRSPPAHATAAAPR